MVLAKAIGLSWNTTKLLLLQAGAEEASELEQCFSSFTRLQLDTAKKALQFYRLREQATTAVSH